MIVNLDLDVIKRIAGMKGGIGYVREDGAMVVVSRITEDWHKATGIEDTKRLVEFLHKNAVATFHFHDVVAFPSARDITVAYRTGLPEIIIAPGEIAICFPVKRLTLEEVDRLVRECDTYEDYWKYKECLLDKLPLNIVIIKIK